jgi:hypothetical protein
MLVERRPEHQDELLAHCGQRVNGAQSSLPPRLDAIPERRLLFNKRNMRRNEECCVVICTGKAIVMMGTKARICAPIAAVSLEDLVPLTHFYRQLDHMLDLSFVRELVKETYATCGRPSIDPLVFFQLQLVMFFEDIRSERLLMQLVADKRKPALVRWIQSG